MFEKIEEFYLNLTWSLRAFLCLVLSCIICYFLFDPFILDKENELKLATMNLNNELNIYKKRMFHKNNLAEKELELYEKKEKILELRKKIPTFFNIDSILHHMAEVTSARGVLLKYFKPQTIIPTVVNSEYVVLPVELEISGKYKMVMKSLEKMTKYQYANKIQNIVLDPKIIDKEKDIDNKKFSKVELQFTKRNNLVIDASSLIYFYRSYTENEFKAVK